MVTIMAPKTNSKSYFETTVIPEIDLLYRTAWSLTRSESEAQDLVQETLLKAFKAIDRFDGRYPRAWLLTILKNTNINRARKKKADLLKDPDTTFANSLEFSDPTTPEILVIDTFFEANVETAYQKLSPDSKAIIDLVDLNGFSYQEAADNLKIPVGTVMSRLHRARKQVRQDLELLDKESDQ